MKATSLACVAFFVVLFVPVTMSAQVAADEENARRAVLAFYDAYNAHEFDDLVDFTTDDWTHIAPNGIVRRGRVETLQSIRQAHATFLKGVTDTPEEVNVRLATPDVAIVTVRSRSSAPAAPNGVRSENQNRIRTFVVVKREGRWLIMQDQNTAQSSN